MRNPTARFSLRRLLVAFTPVALYLIAVGYRSRDMRKRMAIKRQLSSMGAHAVRFGHAEKLGDGDLITAAFRDPIDWEGLVRVRRYGVLELKGVKITDEAIEQLVKLESVGLIIFSLTNVQDEHIDQLSKIDGLNGLWLSHTQLSDECIDGLIAVPGLQWVNLEDTNVTEGGVTRLRAAKPELRIELGSPAAKAGAQLSP